MSKSIMVDDMRYCIFCGMPAEEHHVFFGTANRKIADKYGLTVPLCYLDHREGTDSPHKNRKVDLALKCWAQAVYEAKIGTREEFRADFGKSYL